MLIMKGAPSLHGGVGANSSRSGPSHLPLASRDIKATSPRSLAPSPLSPPAAAGFCCPSSTQAASRRRFPVAQGSAYSTPLTNSSSPDALGADILGVELHKDKHTGASEAQHPDAPGAMQYAVAEQCLKQLLATEDLDMQVRGNPDTVGQAVLLERATSAAMKIAFGDSPLGLASKGLPLLPSSGAPTMASATAMATVLADAATAHHSQSQVVESAPAGGAEGSGPSSADSSRALPSEEVKSIAAMYSRLPAVDAAHLFMQRLLYNINRLNLFWYDDLENYRNERSLYLQQLRNAVEASWQAWETSQMSPDKYKKMSVDEIKSVLEQRYHADVDPPLSAVGRYISCDMGVEGYRQLLAIASLDGLVEASRQSRVCGGAANDIQCMIFKVLMEEYGAGRYAKKHSTFFAAMMKELGLDAQPEVYLDQVPWQVLAGANHNFLLTERRRHYLRYAGGLSFFEIVGPSVYRTYLAAAKRLGLSDQASGYWELHIKEDERHGRWMLEDVAVPLVDRYLKDGWEVLYGYDQEKYFGQRAAAAVLAAIQAADGHEHVGPVQAVVAKRDSTDN